MVKVAKSLVASKIFRLVFSLGLLYFAFSKVDVGSLFDDLSKVSVWFVVAMMAYSLLGMLLGSARWSLLLLEEPKWRDFLFFTKANYIGGFYSLFLSSALGGDLFKWLHLKKRYGDLTKTQLASSVVIDRVIGLSAFAVVAFCMMILGKLTGFIFPDFLFWFFLVLSGGVAVFYGLVFWFDFDKYFFRYKILRRVLQVMEILKKGNKKRIVMALVISVIGQILWTLPFWFYGLVFDAGISLLSVYVLVPIINLILILPISVAGFGAREQLFLYFFVPLGIEKEKVLLVSAFGGVMGVVNALLGGLLMLF